MSEHHVYLNFEQIPLFYLRGGVVPPWECATLERFVLYCRPLVSADYSAPRGPDSEGTGNHSSSCYDAQANLSTKLNLKLMARVAGASDSQSDGVGSSVAAGT